MMFSRSELRLNVEDNIFPNNFPFSSSVLKSWFIRRFHSYYVIESYGSFDWKMVTYHILITKNSRGFIIDYRKI
ncbi:hypothetical protein BpHYR1_012820 [Brachionus plicatilis]|uniref:Uncharacterized protein n=1 Tax=Brachionus plicatilis TaxID=10195 RepID=A0A3M7SJY5_BRAPC|nr:hypothetical protein BpHYR1_012820 [Brachionus plicatilis]